jgi:ketosteroid isomerase-like protein
MDALGPANNGGDLADSADRDSRAKEGIRKFNETVTAASRNQDAAAKAFDRGAYDVVLESVEIESLGEGVAYEIARNITRVRRADGSSIDVPGKSLCIFRCEGDGVWRADVDIFNAIES